MPQYEDPLAELARLIGQDDPFASTIKSVQKSAKSHPTQWEIQESIRRVGGQLWKKEKEPLIKNFWRQLTLAVYEYARDTNKPPWDR